jgi:plasmid stabilization system protein ParE
MSHELLVSSRAHADITSAYQWYEKRVPGLGADFIRRVDATLLLIQRSPQIFRERRGRMRLAMTPRFPFAIYFVWDETARFISIRRVLHFSQNASAHLDR